MSTVSILLSLSPASADSPLPTLSILSSLSLASADAADADSVHFVFCFICLIGSKQEMKVTRVDTLLLKWCEGGQEPYLRSLDHLGRSSVVKE